MALIAQYSISQKEVGISRSHPVRMSVHRGDYDIHPHNHDFYEICIVAKGSALHHTDSEPTVLKPGSVIVVPPSQVHAFTRVRSWEGVNIYYLAEWLLIDLKFLWDDNGLVPLFLAATLFPHSLRPPITQFVLNPTAQAQCLSTMDDLKDELQRQRPSIIYLKANFLKFLILLCRAYAAQEQRELGFQFRREVWAVLNHIEDCIVQSRPFLRDSVSKMLGVSPDHLAKLFRGAIGSSMMAFFQQRRIQHAAVALLNPNVPLSEVAYTLGYSDYAHFAHFFKRYMRMSPGDYRAKFAVEAPQP